MTSKPIHSTAFALVFTLILSSLVTAGTVYITTTNANLSIGTNDQVFIDINNNKIGISNSTPNEKLTINGNLSFVGGGKIIDYNGSLMIQAGGTSNGTAGTANIYFLNSTGITVARLDTNASIGTYGTFYIGRTSTLSADLAEYYLTMDRSIQAGDVVSLTEIILIEDNKTLIAAGLKKGIRGDKSPIGAISLNPGYLLGSRQDNGNTDSRMLVLAGRTPVKVSTENGNISIGDSLAPSSIPGVAMKANNADHIIGRALESLNTGRPCGEFKCGKITAIIVPGKESGINLLLKNEQKIKTLREKNQEIEGRILKIENILGG
jgi:hypothetical protein